MSLCLGRADESTDAVNLLTFLGIRLLRLLQSHDLTTQASVNDNMTTASLGTAGSSGTAAR